MEKEKVHYFLLGTIFGDVNRQPSCNFVWIWPCSMLTIGFTITCIPIV